MTAGRFHYIIIITTAVFVGLAFGCNRSWHRKRADGEAHSLVKTVGADARWDLTDYTIRPDRRSRHFNPYNPDAEPQPQDDAAAHQYMQCVYGMENGKTIGKNGFTQWTDNPFWAQHLNIDANGDVLLNKETAVDLALLHSPAYQKEIEALYLAALDVTLSRFAFDTQFIAKNSLFFTADGELKSGESTLENDSSISAKKTFATGGQFIVGLANNLTWQFSGPDNFKTNSILNFSIVQPLLRGAGRDIVLESLTATERQFLAKIRSFARYRQNFYIDVLHTGVRGGVGYLGLLSQKVRIQNQRQNLVQLEDNLNRMVELFNVGKTNAFQVETTRLSFLKSQNDLISLNNSYENQVEAYLTGTLGLPPDLRVNVEDPLLEQFELMAPELVELQRDTDLLQALLRDETKLIPDDILQRLTSIQQRTEQEMRRLYMDLKKLEDAVPERLMGLTMLKNRPEILRGDVSPSICDTDGFFYRVERRKAELPSQEKQLNAFFQLTRLFLQFDQTTLTEKIKTEKFDAKVLESVYQLEMFDLLPQFQRRVREIRLKYVNEESILSRQRRDAAQEMLRLQLAKDNSGVSAEQANKIDAMLAQAKISAAEIESKRALLTDKIDSEVRLLIENWTGTQFELQSIEGIDPQPDRYRDWLNLIVKRLYNELLVMSIAQSRIRLDSITLVPIDIKPEDAFQYAHQNRLDWMNARSTLVDSWRKIEVAANDLKSLLDVKFSGEMGTTHNNPAKFNAENGTLSVGLEWDSPLSRKKEENAYSKSLVAFQEARRDYYQFVDSVNAALRNTLRSVRNDQLNFEIQRSSIFVAIIKVDLAQLELTRPPKSGGRSDPLSENVAKNLVDALQELLEAQNNFLNVWVTYQLRRLNLELDMGTMQLDERGIWIDRGSMTNQ